jgi:4,5-dihydroxyphthalate decarboxylase
MTRPTFKTVTRSQGNNQALKDGTISPRSFDFEFEEVPVLVRAFRRMVRELEFDICEMALTTYICAREHGVGFTALPIFLVRAFHHGAIAYNVKAGIARPGGQAGRRRARLYGDHRRLGAQHPAGRIRRGFEQDHLGAGR